MVEIIYLFNISGQGQVQRGHVGATASEQVEEGRERIERKESASAPTIHGWSTVTSYILSTHSSTDRTGAHI